MFNVPNVMVWSWFAEGGFAWAGMLALRVGERKMKSPMLTLSTRGFCLCVGCWSVSHRLPLFVLVDFDRRLVRLDRHDQR